MGESYQIRCSPSSPPLQISQVRELTGALWIITVSVVPGPPSATAFWMCRSFQWVPILSWPCADKA